MIHGDGTIPPPLDFELVFTLPSSDSCSSLYQIRLVEDGAIVDPLVDVEDIIVPLSAEILMDELA